MCDKVQAKITIVDRGNRKAVVDEAVFGRPANGQDYLELAGVTGMEATLTVEFDQRIASLKRTFALRLNAIVPNTVKVDVYFDKPSVYLQKIRVDKSLQKQGVGRGVLQQTVRKASTFGFTVIDAWAERYPPADSKFPVKDENREVGYLVLGLWGFDTELTAEVRARMVTLPKGAALPVKLSELLSTADGRELWQEHGVSVKVSLPITLVNAD